MNSVGAEKDREVGKYQVTVTLMVDSGLFIGILDIHNTEYHQL